MYVKHYTLVEKSFQWQCNALLKREVHLANQVQQQTQSDAVSSWSTFAVGLILSPCCIMASFALAYIAFLLGVPSLGAIEL